MHQRPVFAIYSRAMFLALLTGIWVFSLSVNTGLAENWIRFRGPNGSGISTAKGIPTDWSEDDYLWNIELPGVGHSSPIVWGETLFVTSALEIKGEDGGAVRYLFCLDASNGKEKWHRVVGYNPSHKHLKNSYASSTPTTDGNLVFVAFADEEQHTLAAYDYEGTIQWRRNLGPFESQHGQGVSPILYKNLVILANDQKGPSSIIAFEKETGKVAWSTLRNWRRTSYATPMILQQEGEQDQLICVSGATGVTSLNPETGELNWISGEFPVRTVASPVFGKGVIIATCGGGGVGKFMQAVDPTGKGDVSQSHINYTRAKLLPYVPTPVIVGDDLFLWNDNGVVSCVDVKSGDNIWTTRVGGGNYSGSPVVIEGNIYCISEEGVVHIIAASRKSKVISKIPLKDKSHATPVVAGNRLYLRTFHRLMCLPGKEG